MFAGMKSVLPTDARYTVNETARGQYIGVKNNLQFSIYVLVLSSVEGGADAQYTMYPGRTDYWRSFQLLHHQSQMPVFSGKELSHPRKELSFR